ncbi:hypothetical protein HMPREF0972_00793 [Actinomyces sp. oral taxon 848 str. F0332]|nr:hypothetical protein HMPREF0972_00793 [Actinomyces sp. oral taxon 848 str. F0332]
MPIYARISGPFQSMGIASSPADNALAEPIPRRPETRNLARQSHTGHSRTSLPRHALSGSPATLSTRYLFCDRDP